MELKTQQKKAPVSSAFSKAFEINNTKNSSLNKIAIQPKLTIGQPNDKYEQEADRVADQVVNVPFLTGEKSVVRSPESAVLRHSPSPGSDPSHENYP